MNDLEAGWVALEAEDYGQAEQHFRAWEARAGTENARQMARFGLGYALAHTGRFDEAHALYDTLRSEARTQGRREDEHRALHQVGMVERLAGRWADALRTFEAEQEFIADLGNPPLAVAVNAYELGVVSMHLGDPAAARRWLDLSLACAWESDDPIALACAHRGLGDLHVEVGTLDVAREHWHAALTAFETAGDAIGAREVRARLARHNS